MDEVVIYHEIVLVITMATLFHFVERRKATESQMKWRFIIRVRKLSRWIEIQSTLPYVTWYYLWNFIHRFIQFPLYPNLPKAPSKRTKHCWSTTSNIVRCYMLHAFAHPVASCCMLLGVKNCAKFETGQTFSYVRTGARTPKGLPVITQLKIVRLFKNKFMVTTQKTP